ncbi:MAG: PEP-CTERM sorting domain-containing protein [Terrimicrobiaceae bacterium]
MKTLLFGVAVVLCTLTGMRADILYQGQPFGLTVNSIPGTVVEAPFAFLPATLTLLTGDQAYSSSYGSYGSLQLVSNAPILFGSGAYGGGFLYWTSTNALSYGASVDSSLAYEPTAQAVSGYYGWKFVDGAATYYGWAQVNTSNNTITGVAVNTTSGASITVGAVPEPGTWLLLAASGIFFMIMRRLPSGLNCFLVFLGLRKKW